MEKSKLWDYKYEEFPQPFLNEKSHPLSNFIDDLIDKGDVLEAGCGGGILLKILQDKGINAEGFDISEVAIKDCQKNKVNNVQSCSITDFNTNKKYDFILCISTLYYLKNFKEDFAKLVNLLKEDGKLIVNFYNPLKDRQNPVKFREFKRAIRENNLIIEKVIPQSIFTGGIKTKWLCSLNIYILKKEI